MSPGVRRLLLLPTLVVLAAVLAAGVAGLPHFGHYRGPYGQVVSRLAVPARGADNAVAAVVFDIRGVDTMGEELILFCAAVGVVMLLREQTDDPDPADDVVESDALRYGGVLMIGPGIVVAAWLAAFGYVTPGGGFQAGVVFAAIVLLLYLVWSHRAFARVADEHILDVGEGIGAGGYVVIGLAALLSGLPFLRNLFGSGHAGTLLSGGSIGLLNFAVALEVAAANVLLMSHFLGAHVLPLLRSGQA